MYFQNSSDGHDLEVASSLGMISPLSGNQMIQGSSNGGHGAAYANVNNGQDVAIPPSIVADMTSTQPNNFLFPIFDDTDFNSNLDWIVQEPNSDDFLSAPDFFGILGFHENESTETRFTSVTQPVVPSARQSDAGDNDRDLDQEGTNGSFPALGGLLTPQPQEAGNSGEPWPLETPRPPQNHRSLPVLGSDAEEPNAMPRFYSVKTINDRTWHALRKCIMLPFEHNSLQSLDLACFPSKDKLDHCLDLYFAYFNPMLAIVHQPTFDPGKDLVVTLAMISIGACYTNLSGAKAFSNALSELIHRLLVFMAEQDRRFVRTRSYLTAQLLQGTHGYCSGSERLFELSESCRSTLVHHAKCMGLFRFESPHVIQPKGSPEAAWHEWINGEGLRRLGWAVYKYDASVAYLHNNRPFLSTGDINLNLPGSKEHWDAESAQTWASLHPWSKTCPPTSSLRPAIRLLFDGTPDPVKKIVDEEHCFIIELTLVRMIWTLKEIKSSPINDLTTPPIWDDGRTALLRALDNMAVPMGALAKNHTREEMNHFVHRMLLIHIAHIYGAGDLMNWLYPYLRDGPEAENARVRMRQWASEDASRIREVAYHSAQIIGLLRHYPNNMPFEAFLIFHAGVVLSCVANLLPRSRTGPTSNANPAPLPLDMLDPGTGDVTARHAAWVSDGGDEQPSLFGVPALCCAAGRHQVLNQTAALLKRRRVWNMARNLAKVVLSLEAQDSPGEGTLSLPLSSAAASLESFPHRP